MRLILYQDNHIFKHLVYVVLLYLHKYSRPLSEYTTFSRNLILFFDRVLIEGDISKDHIEDELLLVFVFLVKNRIYSIVREIF